MTEDTDVPGNVEAQRLAAEIVEEIDFKLGLSGDVFEDLVVSLTRKLSASALRSAPRSLDGDKLVVMARTLADEAERVTFALVENGGVKPGNLMRAVDVIVSEILAAAGAAPRSTPDARRSLVAQAESEADFLSRRDMPGTAQLLRDLAAAAGAGWTCGCGKTHTADTVNCACHLFGGSAAATPLDIQEAAERAMDSWVRSGMDVSKPGWTDGALPHIVREFSAPVQGEAWKPIESAPKDGRYVLIHGSAGTHIAHWTGLSVTSGGGHAWLNIDARGVGQPTHWMPLPLAPSTPDSVEEPK